MPTADRLAKARHYHQVMLVLARLHRFADVLGSQKQISTRRLADMEEIHPRTVSRTIDFLRDCLGWQIEGDHNGLHLIHRGRPLIAVNEPSSAFLPLHHAAQMAEVIERKGPLPEAIVAAKLFRDSMRLFRRNDKADRLG